MKKVLFLLLKIVGGCFGLLLLLFVSLYIATRGDYNVLPTVANDPSLPSLTLGDVTFHAETFGDSSKPVVIALHGGPGNDYRSLLSLRALSDSFFVVFYDQRGSGLSARVPAEELTLESSIADLNAIADHFSPTAPVHLIGHSWGAMLGSGFTAKYPDRVGRLVLAEPGVLTAEMGARCMEVVQIKPSWALLKLIGKSWFQSLHIKEVDGHERMDFLMEKITTADLPGNPMRGYFCDGDMQTASLEMWRIGTSASMAVRGSSMVDGQFVLDLVSGIEQYRDTILFITGECNQVIGTAYQQGHMALFPRLRHEEIPGAGHTMFGEAPELCNKLVRDHLLAPVSR